MVGNDPGADIENRSSSSWSEFDGSCITQAGGAEPNACRKWGGPDEPYGLKWRKGDNGEVEAAWYRCEHCQGGTFEYHEMVETAANTGRYICDRTGVWTRDSLEWFRADDKPIAPPRSVRFHIWTIYPNFTTWVDIAAERVEVGKDRGKLKKRLFTNPGDGLDAPFIKGLHRNTEAIGHAFLVQPVRLRQRARHRTENEKAPHDGRTYKWVQKTRLIGRALEGVSLRSQQHTLL